MRRILVGSALVACLFAVPTTDEPVTTVQDPPTEPASPVLAGVDLGEVRTALPGNRYWSLGVPTTDPEVRAERERAAEDRNRMLGKILSGNASDAEIAAHYDEIQRINEDYAEFARYVLQRYRGELSERDRGLLELAREMNLQRLAQLPDERLRAVVRLRQQDRARAAWNSPSEGGAP